MFTKEFKLKVGEEAYFKKSSYKEIADKYGIAYVTVTTWRKEFMIENQLGIYKEKSLKDLKEVSLSELSTKEKDLLIMKLEIENERLKKGYLVEGGGQKTSKENI